jgi:hypothetical protein
MPPTKTPTATPTHTPTPTPTATPTLTPTYTPTPKPEVIFADGFESGNFSAWSGKSNRPGLYVHDSAALVGTKGMGARIDQNGDKNPLFVRDDTPQNETRYRARFYFDPNSITMANGDAHRIMAARNNAVDVVRIDLRNTRTGYQIRTSLRTDDGNYVGTRWFTISDAPHMIEFDWRAATGEGANNGYLILWIDEVRMQIVGQVDNDTLRIEQARLGPQASIDTGTWGTEYFDAFVSTRSTYIGLQQASQHSTLGGQEAARP